MAYSTVSEIGRGAFGIVHHVRGPDGQEYARKTLNVAAFSGTTLQRLTARFEREVRYQAQVSHPNVVEIIDHNLRTSPPWFIMPLAAGSLADDIAADRTLGTNLQPALFDILAGLEAIHAHGFVHRDLKPANVLKFRTSTGGVVYKISDFGLIKPGSGDSTTLTASNMGGGTPRYSAPECANNFRRATALADIYSFGAILHDIFDGGPRIPHNKLSVSGPLRPIVRKCTEPTSRRRYRNIERLREELSRVLSTEPITFASQEEEDLVALIERESNLTDDQWDRIFSVVDGNAEDGRSNYNIMRAITGHQMRELAKSSPDMFHGLGLLYADFARTHSFPFEYCDVVSDKANIFYSQGEVELKSEIALAMLVLGTRHNRWRAEQLFVRMAGPGIGDALANRIVIDLRFQDLAFDSLFAQLAQTIGATPEELHPKFRELLPGD